MITDGVTDYGVAIFFVVYAIICRLSTLHILASFERYQQFALPIHIMPLTHGYNELLSEKESIDFFVAMQRTSSFSVFLSFAVFTVAGTMFNLYWSAITMCCASAMNWYNWQLVRQQMIKYYEVADSKSSQWFMKLCCWR